MSDLTTVAAVQQFLPGLASNNTVGLITALISRESEEVRQEISAAVPYEDCTGAQLNGTGTRRLMLPRRPVIRVSAVSIDGVTVPAANTPLQPGWRFDGRMMLALNDRLFPEGLMNVAVDYEAGYESTLTQAVPASNAPTIVPAGSLVKGGWASMDAGVVYANGAALSAVTANAAVGQYTFANGTYAFNAGDANNVVSMTFHYVPGPIAQATIEMVGLDLQQRTSIGFKSQSIGDQSTSYEIRGLTPSVKEMLRPFKQVAPLT